MVNAEENQIDYSLANPDTLTKYKLAGEISGKVLEQVKALCVDGAVILEVCKAGDEALEAEIAKVYKGKKVLKGVAFPTSLAVNNIAAHVSPYPSDADAAAALAAGDVVKISLGAHIDGFAGIVADSVVVGGGEVAGAVADAFHAAWLASEAAIRLVQPAGTNWAVTDAVDKVAAAFGVKPVEDMLSHQQKRNAIDEEKRIILNPSEGKKKSADCTFEEGEVYGIDILISTGEGKVKPTEARTTIYKKTATTYDLKLKASRAIMVEINHKFGAFPFTLRNLEDEKKALMGIQECKQRGLLAPYDVLAEKKGQTIVQFYTTIAVTKNGIVKISGPAVPELAKFKTEKKLEDKDLLNLIAKSLKPSSKNKKKKAAKAEAPAA
ncbi:peptidase M24, structural domain-containing protein [Dipodascopsis tothii]|uniref:peptidase M24, structural domain-containing protein n=1 Tax=Dipodascopsis tothii TaxID=44089 RepID=UPI0034CD4B2F